MGKKLYTLTERQLANQLLKINPALKDTIKRAKRYHKGQIRKYELQKNGKPQPYIVHPLRVALLLKTDDIGVLKAAILHDVLEDTWCNRDAIEKDEGSVVLEMVNDLTTPPNLCGDNAKFWQLGFFPYMNVDAQLIKLADRLDNLKTSKGTPLEAKTRMWSERLLKVVPFPARHNFLWLKLEKELDSLRE